MELISWHKKKVVVTGNGKCGLTKGKIVLDQPVKMTRFVIECQAGVIYPNFSNFPKLSPTLFV